MPKDYGVYQDGTDLWVIDESPLVLGSVSNYKKYSQSDAMALATYLSVSEGEVFKFGRPDDRG